MIDNKDWPTLVAGLRDTLLDQATTTGTKKDLANPNFKAERQKLLQQELAKADRLTFDPAMSDDEFWQVAFSKPFYPRMKSATANKYVGSMFSKYLSDWQALCRPEWNKDGARYRAFMADPDCLQIAERLDLVINAARKINEFKRLNGNPRIVEYLLLHSADWDSLESLRRIFSRARNHLGFGEVTTFHLMTDLGLKVVKPDKFVNFVSIRLGLIDHFQSLDRRTGSVTTTPLRPTVTGAQALSLTTNEAFLWAIQDVYRRLAIETAISIRTLDYMVVKMGQDPEPSAGIARTICMEKKPLCRLCKAKPICAFGKTQ